MSNYSPDFPAAGLVVPTITRRAAEPQPVPDQDPRIRLQTDNYRVVAPQAQRSGSTVYLNSSPLIIEVAEKDSLGGVAWREVSRIERVSISQEQKALYALLAAGAITR
jgi:hypothetical protein